MARGRRRRRRVVSSDEDSSDSDSDDSSVALSESDSDSSESDASISSPSDSSDSDSDDSDSDSGSDSEASVKGFDDSKFPNEDRRKTEEEIRELIRDAKVMKYENEIIERAGIDSYEAMRNCDERKLKRLGMGYSDRDRLLKAFRQHIEGVIEKNREKWERQQEVKRGRKKGKKKSSKRGKSKSSKRSKSSRKNGRSKKSSKKSSRSKSKGKKSKGKSKIDPDEALRKLDTGWSGKRQAWADYKQHEARVAELVEFYDEIGKKRTNAEEHARKLLCSYPGGVHKLVIALDKKYHHIPYGWEELLEEAYRLQEYEGSGSD